MNFLEISHVSYTYAGGYTALRDVGFSVRQGEYVAISGANGSGKSTLAHLICGFLDVQSGTIGGEAYRGESWVMPAAAAENRDECAGGSAECAVSALGTVGSLGIVGRREVCVPSGIVFQNPENQIVASTVWRDTAFGPENIHLCDAVIEARVREALELTALIDKAAHGSATLSLGQKQKLALAGILALGPRLLVLDEAGAMIDPTARAAIFDFVDARHRDGLTVISISHNKDEVVRAERLIFLQNGAVAFDGLPAVFMRENPFFDGGRTGKGAKENGGIAPLFEQQANSILVGGAESVNRIQPDNGARLEKNAETQNGTQLFDIQAKTDDTAAPIFNNIAKVPLISGAESGNGVRLAKAEESDMCARLEPNAHPGNCAHLAEDAQQPQRAVALLFNGVGFSHKGGAPLFTDFSLSIERGTLTALVGSSGAGKSTLFELACGLRTCQSGTICAVSRPVLALQDAACALFEEFVADDVAYGPMQHGIHGRALKERVQNALDEVGLPFTQFADRRISTLSGGQQRKVALAGILALDADIVLFDEPASSLDPESRVCVLELMRRLCARGKTVVFSTHRSEEAAYADRIIRIESGALVSDTGIAAQTNNAAAQNKAATMQTDEAVAENHELTAHANEAAAEKQNSAHTQIAPVPQDVTTCTQTTAAPREADTDIDTQNQATAHARDGAAVQNTDSIQTDTESPQTKTSRAVCTQTELPILSPLPNSDLIEALSGTGAQLFASSFTDGAKTPQTRKSGRGAHNACSAHNTHNAPGTQTPSAHQFRADLSEQTHGTACPDATQSTHSAHIPSSTIIQNRAPTDNAAHIPSSSTIQSHTPTDNAAHIPSSSTIQNTASKQNGGSAQKDSRTAREPKTKPPFVHRLPPLAKYVVLLVFLACGIGFSSLPALVAVCALGIVYALLAAYPIKRLAVNVIKILPWMAVFFVLQMVFFPAQAGDTCYWHMGFVTLTDAKILFGIKTVLHYVAALIAFSVFIASTDETEILDGMKALLSPLSYLHIPVRHAVLLTVVVFRFVPILTDEAARIIKAQLIRSGGNALKKKRRFFARVRALIPIFVPLIVRTLKRAESFAEALEARYYN